MNYKSEFLSPDDFDDPRFKQIWNKLERGSDMTVFQTYEWYKGLIELYRKEKVANWFRKWVFVVIEKDDIPIMILPISVLKVGFGGRMGVKKGYYIIGSHGYTDYQNLIYDCFDEGALKYAIESLKNEYKLNHFCIECLLCNTSFYGFLKQNYEIIEYDGNCVSLSLPDTFDEYSKKLSKHARQNIRTAINRQNRDGLNIRYEMRSRLDDDVKEELKRIRNSRLKKKNKAAFDNASWKGRIYGRVRRRFTKFFFSGQDIWKCENNIWCFLVYNQNDIAGFYWGLKKDNTLYFILAGVNEKYAWYSPSISQFYLYIQEMYNDEDRDISVIDFTRGNEKYKYDLGGTDTGCSRVMFTV